MYIIVDTVDGTFENDASQINLYNISNHNGPCFVHFNDVLKKFERKELKTISIFFDDKDRKPCNEG